MLISDFDLLNVPASQELVHGRFEASHNLRRVASSVEMVKKAQNAEKTVPMYRRSWNFAFQVSTTVLADFGHILDEVSTCLLKKVVLQQALASSSFFVHLQAMNTIPRPTFGHAAGG